MLMNKIPCLDKGYVAFIGSMNRGDILKKMSLELFHTADTSNLADIGQLTVIIKCPLFVQLNLSKFNLKLISVPTETLEAYVPNIGEIKGSDRETNSLISDDMGRTTEALLINPASYQADGCDRFISQVLMPISTYTTLIVQGSYKEFEKFCNQSGIPGSNKKLCLCSEQHHKDGVEIMAKTKSKNKKTTWSKSKRPQKERKDPRVQEVYEEEIEFVCPVRGRVKQKVKVKKYKSLGEMMERNVVYGSSSIEKLEEKDDGLNMYGNTDEDMETVGPEQ